MSTEHESAPSMSGGMASELMRLRAAYSDQIGTIKALRDLMDNHVHAIKAHCAAASADKALIRELVEALRGATLFCNQDGSPCDGFRFREEVLKARKVLEKAKEYT